MPLCASTEFDRSAAFLRSFHRLNIFILHYFIFYFLIRVRYVKHVTMINKKINNAFASYISG